jgi:predicted permease
MAWHRRLLNLLRPGRVWRDIDREMAFHLEERIDELVAGGMSPDEARREARRRFGRVETIRRRIRDVDVVGWLESLLFDIRYAFRGLGAHRGFTAVAVASLALGIGANTAIFSLIDAVLLRSLPVRNPGEIVRLSVRDGNNNFTNPLWEQIRDRQHFLAGTLAFSDYAPFDLSRGGPVRRASGAWVSGDYFRMLGVSPATGRLLGPADDVRGCAGTAVLSHDFWQREYGGAGDIVGRTISLNGHPFQIVGVARAGFSGINVGRPAEIFVPLCAVAVLRPGSDMLDARSTWYLNVFGRLRPGETLAQARAGLAALSRSAFEATVPRDWSPAEQKDYRERTLTARSASNGMSRLRSRYDHALYVLLLVVGVVLLIACANVAQLLLARATTRKHEVAVRLALGAGRARLARQTLVESLLVALTGASLGLLFARWSSRLLVGFIARGGRGVRLDLSLDPRVLGFTIGVAVVTALLFGLAPVLRSNEIRPASAMRGTGRGVLGEDGHGAGRGIVIAQVALSFVLVVAAGLLVGSFRRLDTQDPGFRRRGVLVVTAEWSNLHLSGAEQQAFPRRLLDRMRTLPGVAGAGAAEFTPVSGTSWNEAVSADGRVPTSHRDAILWFNGVTDGYLAALGTRLLAGRDFTPGDDAASAKVVILNRTAARRYFGNAAPLGKTIRLVSHDTLGASLRVVGIMEDAKYLRMDEAMRPTAYVPLAQTGTGSQVRLALRANGPPRALIPEVTASMRTLNPAIALEFTTLDDQVAASLARPRLLATLSGFFGALALLLAVIGLYGTMSYAVARRRNEIGVRIALGAARRRILGMVARDAAIVVALGIGAGVLLALVATRIVESFLYGVTATDPGTLALSAAVLAVVAIGAALAPAWRAATVDPVVALREE